MTRPNHVKKESPIRRSLSIPATTTLSYDFDEFNGKTLKQGILAGPVAAAPAAKGPPAGGKKEEVKEEKKEDSEGGDMGFGLFD